MTQVLTSGEANSTSFHSKCGCVAVTENFHKALPVISRLFPFIGEQLDAPCSRVGHLYRPRPFINVDNRTNYSSK